MSSPSSIYTVLISFRSQDLQQLEPPPSETNSTATSIQNELREDNVGGLKSAQKSLPVSLADNSNPFAQNRPHSTWNYEHQPASITSLYKCFTSAGDDVVAEPSSITQSSTPKESEHNIGTRLRLLRRRKLSRQKRSGVCLSMSIIIRTYLPLRKEVLKKPDCPLHSSILALLGRGRFCRQGCLVPRSARRCSCSCAQQNQADE